MHIKPPDDNILQSSFPLVWWESEDVSIAEEGGAGAGGGGGECNSSFNLEQALHLRVARSEGSRTLFCSYPYCTSEEQSRLNKSQNNIFTYK